MEFMSFSDHAEVAEYIMELAFHGNTVYTACKYDDARILLKELASYRESTIESAMIAGPEYDGYDKEFYITVDKCFNIFVEQAWHEDNKWHPAGYLNFEADFFLLFGDCNSKIIEAVMEDDDEDSCELVEVYVGDEEDLADEEDDDDDDEESDEFDIEISEECFADIIELLKRIKDALK